VSRCGLIPSSGHVSSMGEATCLCETCLSLVPARVEESETQVTYVKRCPRHGTHRTLVSTDPEYYRQCRARRRDVGYSATTATAMAIIEVVDGCDCMCPTCSAASEPQIRDIWKVEDVDAALSVLKTSQRIDLLMISGGEPTLHPCIIDLLSRAHTAGIARVMLITNGKRIARDPVFVGELASLGSWLEIYLQFDSLNEQVLRDLRGEDLRDVRLRALEQLERHKIATTLVCVVKKNVNDLEIPSIVDVGLTYDCVRGVTYQPIRAVGRTEGYNPDTQRITLSEIRRSLIESGHFDADGIQPHPCNPETICIGYISRQTRECLTKDLLHDPNEDPQQPLPVQGIRPPMFFSSLSEISGHKYADVFRVCVVSYLDRYDFSVESALQSCIHFLNKDGSLTPLETHYLFSNAGIRPSLVTIYNADSF
jgi:uncharacterized radical SAM superfamily Fe-S cluster-containing enzyme